MMSRRILISAFLTLLLFLIGCSEKNDFPVLQGPYIGQTPPGMTPEIFAPGIISTGKHELMLSFTPDGKELFYVLDGAPHNVIVCMKEKNNKWTTPQVVSFSGQYHSEFTLAPDGNKIVFCSRQPLDGSNEPLKINIARFVTRTKSGWSSATPLESLSKSGTAAYPSISLYENVFFYSEREEGLGKDDIWMSRYIDGKYLEPENLGASINTDHIEVDPFIAPDESYLIFCRKDDGFGGFDLYISYKKSDGSWTKAINMGEKINSTYHDVCPVVTLDGNYFSFSSNRTTFKSYSEDPVTYEEKLNILNNPGNGNADIYWVDVRIIEDLKPKELK
jgi:Tol biopolymer transport system component